MTNIKAKSLNQLFKNGSDFSFNKVDYKSQHITKDVTRLMEKQDKVMKSSEVDLNELKNIIFTL